MPKWDYLTAWGKTYDYPEPETYGTDFYNNQGTGTGTCRSNEPHRTPYTTPSTACVAAGELVGWAVVIDVDIYRYM